LAVSWAAGYTAGDIVHYRESSGFEAKLSAGILLAIVAAAGYGVGRIFAGVGLQHIKPLPGSIISLIFGGLLVLAVSLIFRYEALVSISLITLGWIVVIGILSFALGRVFTFLGIKHIGASRGTSVYASYPLFTMALAVPFLGETVSLALVTGIVLIIGGLALLFSEREAEKSVAGGANRLLGYGFSLAAAVIYGANAVIIKWVVSDMVDPLVTLTIAIFVGVAILLVPAGRGLGAAVKSNPRATGILALSGMINTLGAMSLYSALEVAPAVVVAPLGATSPLFTLVGTYLFLRRLDRVTYHVALGCLVVVIGGILVTIS
jgi:drug/metabolite transporter (DMT)-like permease